MKRRKLPAAGILAAALLAASPLGAQGGLTLEQARSSALAHSRTLRQALLSVDSALLTEKLQSYQLLPSLSVGAGASASYPSTVSRNTLGASLGVSVSQTIYDGGRLSLLAAIDKLQTRMAREEARAEYFGVLGSVDSAFYSLLEAQASVEAAQSDLEAYRTHLELAQAKLEAGIIPRYAYLQAESEAAARQTALIQSQGRLSVEEARLASLTGLAGPLRPAGVDFSGLEDLQQKVGGLAGDKVTALVEAAFGSALANNPSLSQYALASQEAKKQVALASADCLPSLGASFSHSFDLTPGQAPDPGSGSFSLSASIPLDIWKTKASVRAAQIAAQQADLEADDSSQSLRLEIQSAVYDCISSARSASSAKKALEYAENYYQSVLELFKLSSASSSDLSDAQSLLSANRTALITARYSFLADLSSLRALAGLQTQSQLLGLIR
jgi:outer membrane protein